MCSQHIDTSNHTKALSVHSSLTPAITPRIVLCVHSTVTPAITPMLGLCVYSTLTPATTPRLGLCVHSTLIPATAAKTHLKVVMRCILITRQILCKLWKRNPLDQSTIRSHLAVRIYTRPKRPHTHVKDSAVHTASVDYRNAKLTQNALKMSVSSKCWSWALYGRGRRRQHVIHCHYSSLSRACVTGSQWGDHDTSSQGSDGTRQAAHK